MKQPKANSRNKGAAFERAIAAQLFGLTGVTFQRNLEQVRTVDHSDLTPDDPAFPFALECKRYASGTGCKPAWRAQSARAAALIGKHPCVIYKYDRLDTRVSVPFSAIAAAMGGDANPDEWAEITIEGLAYLAAEIMAQTNSGEDRGESPRGRSPRRILATTTPRQTEKQTEQST